MKLDSNQNNFETLKKKQLICVNSIGVIRSVVALYIIFNHM